MGQVRNIRKPIESEVILAGMVQQLPHEYASPQYCRGYRDAWLKCAEVIEWMREIGVGEERQLDFILGAWSDMLMAWENDCVNKFIQRYPELEAQVEQYNLSQNTDKRKPLSRKQVIQVRQDRRQKS